jgi:hypothetical protein
MFICAIFHLYYVGALESLIAEHDIEKLEISNQKIIIVPR